MSGAWVAGTVRARLLLGRRAGADAAARVRCCTSLPAAIAALSDTAYGARLHPELDLRDAQHAVAATLLWHMRVLAGWLPAGGAAQVRVLAGWFEIQNIDERMATLAGGESRQTFELGGMATVWRRVAAAPSAAAVRARLAASPWGDPGSDLPADIGLALRLRWARRVAAEVAGAPAWGRALGALVVARELLAGRDRALRQAPALPVAWRSAPDVGALRALVPGALRWVLEDVDGAAGLWRAEERYWERLEAAAQGLLVRPAWDAGPLPAVLVLLAADARRVSAALAVAHGGGPGMHRDAAA